MTAEVVGDDLPPFLEHPRQALEMPRMTAHIVDADHRGEIGDTPAKDPKRRHGPIV